MNRSDGNETRVQEDRERGTHAAGESAVPGDRWSGVRTPAQIGEAHREEDGEAWIAPLGRKALGEKVEQEARDQESRAPHSQGPLIMPGSVDASIGQRAMSAVVDVAFFVVVGVLGFTRVLSEPLLGALLGSYASARFGIAYGKQQTVVALASQQDRRQGGDGGGTGGSGGYGQVREPSDRPAPPPRVRDNRIDEPYKRRDGAPLPIPSTSPIVSAFQEITKAR